MSAPQPRANCHHCGQNMVVRDESLTESDRHRMRDAAEKLQLLCFCSAKKRLLAILSVLSITVWVLLGVLAVSKNAAENRLPSATLTNIHGNDVNYYDRLGPHTGISNGSTNGRQRGTSHKDTLWHRSSRMLLRPRSLRWLPEYQKFVGERCDALLSGDIDEQQRALQFGMQHKAKFWCYRDRRLANAACSELLNSALAAGLKGRPAADGHEQREQPEFFTYEPLPEESDFPLAFALRVHTCATQVELLLQAIYAPQNFYCLHIDGGAAPEFIAAVRRLAHCLPNVVMAPVRNDFVYKSVSQMEADVECMDLALQSQVTWRYFINMAGQELPLMSNYELVQRLRALNGSSHLNAVQKEVHSYRYEFVYWCRSAATNKTVKCRPPLKRKTRLPELETIRKSWAYGFFSRALVEFIREPDGLGRRLYDWFADTLCPEEHYFATIVWLPQAPGGDSTGTSTRAVKWERLPEGHCHSGHYVRGVCIYGAEDLPELISSGLAIANKFYFDKNPVAVRCLVDSIMRKKADPRRRLLTTPSPPRQELMFQSSKSGRLSLLSSPTEVVSAVAVELASATEFSDTAAVAANFTGSL